MPDTLSDDVARLSEGAMTFSHTLKRLEYRGRAGQAWTLDIDEAALRNWLQAILMDGGGQASAGAPHEAAIRLLLLTATELDARGEDPFASRRSRPRRPR